MAKRTYGSAFSLRLTATAITSAATTRLEDGGSVMLLIKTDKEEQEDAQSAQPALD